MERGETIYSITGKKQILNSQKIGIGFLIIGILAFLGFFAILPDTTRENNTPAVFLFSFGICSTIVGLISIFVKTPEYVVYENGILIPSTPAQKLPKEGLFIAFNEIVDVRLSEDNTKIFIKARDKNNRLHQYMLISDNPQLLFQWIEYGQSNFLERDETKANLG